jgi:hypothetical protein
MKPPRLFGAVGALVVLLLATAAAAAETGPDGAATLPAATESPTAVTMDVWSVDAGGGESSHDDLSLVATIGQHDAGVVARDGLVLAGGLWGGEVELGGVFADGFESGDVGAWSSVVGLNPEEK